jgi:hypothetical protein
MQKKTWLFPTERNHPGHSQEVVNLVDAMARELSGGTWPDEIRERKTIWGRTYEFYLKLLIWFPKQHTDTPQPTANPLLVNKADLKLYRRPCPVFAPPGQCRGNHLNSSLIEGSLCTCPATGGRTDGTPRDKQ